MTRRIALALALGALVAVSACSTTSVVATAIPEGPATQAPATAVPPTPIIVYVTPTPAVTPAPTPAATSKFREFGEGTFMVGKDIQPGTYRTRAASSGCFWARLKGFGGTTDDIITSAFGNAPVIVEITASDKGFQSTGCGTWTTDLSAIIPIGSPIPDGMYIVGTDLTAGTYRSAASHNCFWARLKGFSDDLNNIITSAVTDSGAIVTVSASDKGFESQGCAPWIKQ